MTKTVRESRRNKRSELSRRLAGYNGPELSDAYAGVNNMAAADARDAGDTMQGRRVYMDDEGCLPPYQPGDYGKDKNGIWLVMTPNGVLGVLNDGHTLIEHEDGTLTVQPSILYDKVPGEYWHGWLTAGVWREV